MNQFRLVIQVLVTVEEHSPWLVAVSKRTRGAGESTGREARVWVEVKTRRSEGFL